MNADPAGKFFHPDNQDKQWVDWRLPENRRHMFFRWLQWRVRWSDLDHYAVTNAYCDASGAKSPTGLPATKEQRYWMALIFGMTYQSSMAWTIFWNHPDFWKVNLEQMQAWNVANLERQRYARDTKYNKGRVTDQTESLMKIIGPYGSIEKFFAKFVDEDEHRSFERCFEAVLGFHKYGRMTAWLTCQNLFEVCGLPIRPKSMLADDPSNWSVRSGIMYLLNKEELVEAGSEEKVKLSPADLQMVRDAEADLYAESLDWIDQDKRHIWSNFLLESHLCQYKKLLTGGDYGGHSSGDHVSRCTWLRDRWPEINYQAFYEDAVQNHHPLVRLKRESPALRRLCMLTGQVINMHQDYDDLPDMYKELGLDGDLLFNLDNDPIVLGKVERYVEAQEGNYLAEQELLSTY